MRRALIVGSTGLIGKALLGKLLEDSAYSEVTSLTRRPSEIVHPKLVTRVVDFDSLNLLQDNLVVDDVFCCLGTTMKKAGSKEAFLKVDHDYPLALARLAKEKGARQFLLVSALGADMNSSFYYNAVKGKIEKAIGSVGFHSYHIFRPSLLLGHRTENRPGEEAAKTFYRIFDFLIPRKYKGIEGSKVAEAMLFHAKQQREGNFIHSSRELQDFNP